MLKKHTFSPNHKVVTNSPHNFHPAGKPATATMGAPPDQLGGGPSAAPGGGMDASGGPSANFCNGGAADGKFIQKAIKHPGALHHDLNVPEGQKIPAGKLASAAAGNYGAKTEQRAHLAQTMKHFDDGGYTGAPSKAEMAVDAVKTASGYNQAATAVRDSVDKARSAAQSATNKKIDDAERSATTGE